LEDEDKGRIVAELCAVRGGDFQVSPPSRNTTPQHLFTWIRAARMEPSPCRRRRTAFVPVVRRISAAGKVPPVTGRGFEITGTIKVRCVTGGCTHCRGGFARGSAAAK